MNTTELIKLLQKYEKGASGRSREISFQIKGTRKSFIPESEVTVIGTGDGCAGAEICLEIRADK